MISEHLIFNAWDSKLTWGDDQYPAVNWNTVDIQDQWNNFMYKQHSVLQKCNKTT